MHFELGKIFYFVSKSELIDFDADKALNKGFGCTGVANLALRVLFI